MTEKTHAKNEVHKFRMKIRKADVQKPEKPKPRKQKPGKPKPGTKQPDGNKHRKQITLIYR